MSTFAEPGATRTSLPVGGTREAVNGRSEHSFTGVMVCAECHVGPEMGFQFSKWRMGPHARAYAMLATAEGYELAKKSGVEGNPQESRFCLECQDFPCKRLKSLDKRYRTKYHMSMIENLIFIRDYGLAKFLKREEEKWKCRDCGEMICCHNGLCLNCQMDILLQNKKYRWGER